MAVDVYLRIMTRNQKSQYAVTYDGGNETTPRSVNVGDIRGFYIQSVWEQTSDYMRTVYFWVKVTGVPNAIAVKFYEKLKMVVHDGNGVPLYQSAFSLAGPNRTYSQVKSWLQSNYPDAFDYVQTYFNREATVPIDGVFSVPYTWMRAHIYDKRNDGWADPTEFEV